MNENELKQKILTAFALTKCPDERNLVYDNSSHNTEGNEIKRFFCGKTVQELRVSTDLLVANSQSIFFLTEEAYRYYLPAFILCTLDNWNASDSIPQAVLYSFLPDENTQKSSLDYFSDSEKCAITDYVDFVFKAYGDEFPDQDWLRAKLNLL
jgi:hypothetical protein